MQVNRCRPGRIECFTDGGKIRQESVVLPLFAAGAGGEDDGISRSDADGRCAADGQDGNGLAHVLPFPAGQIDFFKGELRLVEQIERPLFPTQCFHQTVNPP